ncbi:hypothetical protein U6X45_12370, partial [Cutibacterium acnes]
WQLAQHDGVLHHQPVKARHRPAAPVEHLPSLLYGLPQQRLADLVEARQAPAALWRWRQRQWGKRLSQHVPAGVGDQRQAVGTRGQRLGQGVD